MTVSAPPRPPSQAPEARESKPLDRDEIEALVEALIEEARREQRRRHRRYWVLAALALFVGAVILTLLEGGAASQTASSTLSARSRLATGTSMSKIAFVGYPNDAGGKVLGVLFVVNADGSGKQRLAVSDYATPTWSPDGRKILFTNGRINVVNADGSEQRKLTNSQRSEAGPVWSPDGRRIAFLRYAGKGGTGWELYAMNADGSAQRRLARDAGLAAWSPDGRRIAFVRRLDGKREIFVVNANGGAPRNLTRNPAEDFDPVWSPDGKRIAFVRAWQVYVMNADGSGQRRLTLDGPRNLSPSWSPDRQKIAFDRRLGWRQPKYRHGNRDYYGDHRASIYEVYVINADGSGQTKLAAFRDRSPGGYTGAEPLWSPDGRKIAFRSARGGNWEIYVINADGSKLRNVSRNPAYSNCCFSWSPGQT